MTKPLHAGLAAESGVRAAGFVSAGITANNGILEAPIGYCVAFAGKDGYRLDEITGRLGNPYVFEEPGNNLKPYPCCMSAHASIDALRDLIAEEELSAVGVERIDVELMAPNMSNLSYHDPKTGLEGKFSAEYTLARMLTDRALTLSTFTDEAVNEPGVRETMKKIHVRLAENVEWKQGAARPITLTVQTGDGRKFEKRANISRGNAGWPLTDEEVRDKFRDCAGVTLSPEKTGEALSALEQIESAPGIDPIMSMLA
jgi:2-methylcitrate dehydratase PrpD